MTYRTIVTARSLPHTLPRTIFAWPRACRKPPAARIGRHKLTTRDNDSGPGGTGERKPPCRTGQVGLIHARKALNISLYCLSAEPG